MINNIKKVSGRGQLGSHNSLRPCQALPCLCSCMEPSIYICWGCDRRDDN
ncbi:hypothetical protein AAZX31_14G064100 [Glycine max]